jgi:hypothetical protein
MKEVVKFDVESAVRRFREAWGLAVESIVRVATIYVEAIDAEAGAKDAFAAALGDVVPAGAWAQLEAVGRRALHPRIMLGTAGRYSARLRRLPYSDQKKALEERVEMLAADGTPLLVEAAGLSPEQFEQVVAADHIRSLAEQRAWLERRPQAAQPEAERLPYRLHAGKVVFTRGVEMTRAEVQRLLQVM